jgi:hypothetical protein
MRLPAWLTRIFLILSALFLGTGYGLNGNPLVSLSLAALLAIGLVFLWRGWGWFLSILLVLFTGFAAAGIYFEVAHAWLFLGALAGLLSWDQEQFARSLISAGRIESPTRLIKARLARLSWVSLCALLLVWLTYLIQVEFTFGVAVLLSVLAILGLSQGIAYLRRSGST